MRTLRSMLGMAVCLYAGSTLAAPAMTTDQQVGYSLGFMLGERHAEQIPDLNVDSFMQGFKDAYAKSNPAMTREQMQAVLEQFRSRMVQKMRTEHDKEAAANKATGDQFLAKKSSEAGVKRLADGLEYRVIHAGQGPHPKPTDTVKVNYEGKLISGQVFDSSYERHEPASFQLNEVIPGWTEGLQKMSVGSTYEFYIPSALAYGENGAGPIPPNSTLIFKVELLAINPPAAAAAAAKH